MSDFENCPSCFNGLLDAIALLKCAIKGEEDQEGFDLLMRQIDKREVIAGFARLTEILLDWYAHATGNCPTTAEWANATLDRARTLALEHHSHE